MKAQMFANTVKEIVAPRVPEWESQLLDWPVVFTMAMWWKAISDSPWGTVDASTIPRSPDPLPAPFTGLDGKTYLFGVNLHHPIAIAFAVIHELGHVVMDLSGQNSPQEEWIEGLFGMPPGHGDKWHHYTERLGLRNFYCCDDTNNIGAHNFAPEVWKQINALPWPTYPWKEDEDAEQAANWPSVSIQAEGQTAVPLFHRVPRVEKSRCGR